MLFDREGPEVQKAFSFASPFIRAARPPPPPLLLRPERETSDYVNSKANEGTCNIVNCNLKTVSQIWLGALLLACS